MRDVAVRLMQLEYAPLVAAALLEAYHPYSRGPEQRGAGARDSKREWIRRGRRDATGR